ncbi:secreted antigen 1 [Babesia divergens]|uniref:Secreted antigen 1 n=1 Tax=Babesia divergens TaxID=32595 RepID=A0AAD9GEG7_BABDI|nr:secreted antigen 1 [Babesia divergens]
MLQEKLQALEAGLGNASEESSTDDIKDSTVESQDAVPEDRKEPHGFSDFSNEFNSEYEEKESIKEAEKSNEEHEQHHVAKKTETDVTSYPSSINLPDGSNNPNGSMATPYSNGAAEDMEAEQEERLKEMQEISEDLKDSPVESSSTSSAPALQSGLVFESSTWDDSKLASAFVFLEQFCWDVRSDKFDKNLKAFNGAQWFSVKLKSLCSIISSRLGSLSANLVPSGVTVNPYEKALKSEKFNTYVEWLVKNIPGIRESVQKMFNESKKLNKAQLKDTTSMGPSKYGFEFVGDKWKPFVHYKLKDLTWCMRTNLRYLQETLGKTPKTFPKTSIVESDFDLVFQRSEWDDSMLASVVLFLREFCWDVKTKKFSGKVSEGLSKACVNVSSTLDSLTKNFTPTYGPGRVDEIPMDLYEGILKPEDFKDYVKWLVGNIQNITESFKRMLKESKELTEKELTKSDSVGPLKYGFVYNGDGWKQWIQRTAMPLPPWLRDSYVDLKGVTSDIISSLKRLHSQLSEIL